jgi:hypothetical protein
VVAPVRVLSFLLLSAEVVQEEKRDGALNEKRHVTERRRRHRRDRIRSSFIGAFSIRSTLRQKEMRRTL